MQKMKRGNIIIEVDEKNILKAKKLGFKIYNGHALPNAEVEFNE